MSLIDPYFIEKIKLLINEGLNLEKIIEEYKDGIFEEYIIANYYHINNGPDLRDYQIDAVNEAKETLINKNNNNYKLFWCCGLGKTKTSLSISKQLNFKTILVSVPSILLLEQFSSELIYFYPLSQIFKYYSKESTNTNIMINNLEIYLKSSQRFKIVLTTYHSSKHILQCVKNLKFKFDFIILDEAHHLHSKDSKLFSYILNIPFKKRLILTATPNISNETEHTLSLEKSDIFKGKSNTKGVDWSIKNNYITDYNIIVLNMKYGDLYSNILDLCKNTELILAAFMTLKCIFNNKSKKIIIFCNKVENSKKVKEIIGILLDKYKNDLTLFNNYNLDLDVGNYELSSNDSAEKRKEILGLFTTKEYGIMSSVQLFGEGYDYPGLDSVLFAEKMDSTIRIVQSALRPCRKDKNNTLKKANILIPVFENDCNKLKQIILKMKTVDNIIDKIQIYNKKSFNFSRQYSNNYISYNKFDLNSENKKILEKIELEYLDNNLFNETDNVDFTKSKVITCIIKKNNKIISENKKYRKILIDIWKNIEKCDLIKTSTFKFKSEKEDGEKGFNWCECIKLSFQSKNSNGCLKEIIKMIKTYNFNIDMDIMLNNKEIFNLSL